MGVFLSYATHCFVRLYTCAWAYESPSSPTCGNLDGCYDQWQPRCSLFCMNHNCRSWLWGSNVTKCGWKNFYGPGLPAVGIKLHGATPFPIGDHFSFTWPDMYVVNVMQYCHPPFQQSFNAALICSATPPKMVYNWSNPWQELSTGWFLCDICQIFALCNISRLWWRCLNGSVSVSYIKKHKPITQTY